MDDGAAALSPGEHRCRLRVGSEPAIVNWSITPTETRVGARWRRGSDTVLTAELGVGGVSSDERDLPMLWTMLRLVRADSSVVPRQ